MIESQATRRQLIATIAAAGATGAAGSVMGQRATQPQSTQLANAPAATSPASQPDSLNVGDVAAADKVAARDYPTDTERQLMLPSLETYRKRLRKYRSTPIDATIEPAVSFDPRVAGTSIPSGVSSCTLSTASAPEFDGHADVLAFMSVADLSRLIKSRQITSTQLTKIYLDRLKRTNEKLLCVVTLTEELALKQAAKADEEIAAGNYRGPLHGIPYGAKDLLATKGYPTTYGIAAFKDQLLDFDATVIQRLESAGAVLVAKLSLGELAMGDVWFGGKTRNPWNTEEGSSGSSAGPCAATAAGLVGFAIGSETLGSIVSPCVACGTTGLRPTWGRVSRYGALPLTWTLDKLGPICRGVEDCALVLSAICGKDENDPTAADVPLVWNPRTEFKSIRIGYNAAAFSFEGEQWKDAELKKLYQDVFAQMKSMFGEMIPVTLPKPDNYSGLVGAMIAAESSSAFGDLLFDGRIRDLVQQAEGSWPNTFRVGSTIPAADYLRAMRLRAMLMREMAEAMKDVDVMISVPYAGPTLAFTNLTGHPTLITRCGMKDRRPKMIEFVGALYREDAICRVAFEYERATEWHMVMPSI